MADTKQWAAQVEEAFRSVVLGNDDDAARFSALKMSMLELMRGAYEQGLQDAVGIQGDRMLQIEKRRLVAMLAAGVQSTDARVRDAQVETAVKMAEQIFDTVK